MDKPLLDSIKVIPFAVFFIVIIWFVVGNIRTFGLTGGPTPCDGSSPSSVTVKKPKANDVIAEDLPYTIKWSTCNAVGPYTVTLKRADGWSLGLGTTALATSKSLTVTLDSANIRPDSYTVSVVAATGTTGVSDAFSLSTPFPNRYYNEIFTSYTTTSDIIYGTATNSDGSTATLTLDLYQPTGDTGKSRAAIIFVHGGAFTGGDKDQGSNAELFAKSYALRGYVTASINYRLQTKNNKGYVAINDQLKTTYDAKAAIRWLRANATNYGVDPNRIAIGGSSAGAAISAQVAYDNEDGDGDNISTPGISDSVTSVMVFKGYLIKDKVNGDTVVDSGEPAIVNIIGSLDDFLSAATALNDSTVAVGIPSLFYVVDGGTHTNIGWSNTLQYSVPFFCKWNAGFCTTDAQDASITTTVTGSGNDGGE